MTRAMLIFAAFGLSACSGGGNWVDAPQACMGGWGIVQLGNVKAMTERMLTGAPEPKPSSTDLKEVIEKEIESERKNGMSEAELKKGREAMEGIIALGARAVCGNVGKSYTGDWECTAERQRVRCK